MYRRNGKTTKSRLLALRADKEIADYKAEVSKLTTSVDTSGKKSQSGLDLYQPSDSEA